MKQNCFECVMCLFVYIANYQALFTGDEQIAGDEQLLSSAIYDISCK